MEIPVRLQARRGSMPPGSNISFDLDFDPVNRPRRESSG
jgi:hypothetical protein